MRVQQSETTECTGALSVQTLHFSGETVSVSHSTLPHMQCPHIMPLHIKNNYVARIFAVSPPNKVGLLSSHFSPSNEQKTVITIVSILGYIIYPFYEE